MIDQILIQSGLQHFETKQRALHTRRCQRHAHHVQYILSFQFLHIVYGLAGDVVHQHGGGRLADDATIAAERNLGDMCVVIAQLDVDADPVAAQGIILLV
jgi:hypothetical protein